MDRVRKQPFQENSHRRNDENANSSHHHRHSKKSKTSIPDLTRVFTFALSHSPVQVQLLETNTVYALVDIICQTTTVGMDESVDEHMWDIYVEGIHATFNSSDDYVDMGGHFPDDNGPLCKASQTQLKELDLTNHTTLYLKYDYGTTCYYQITLVNTEYFSNDQFEVASTFPRVKPTKHPSTYHEFRTDPAIDLNELFPKLNKFITDAEMLKINLFQPGRKRNYGYTERGNMGIKHMIFLPSKPAKDLSNYLHTFDCACESNPPPDEFSWFSMIAYPHEFNKSYGKYGQDLETGFAELVQATQCNHVSALNKVFPKVAALAGYKKDKKVPRGWIWYQDNLLMICSGSARVVPCNAPPGTAFFGEDQHQPQSPDDILVQARVGINSLHHLLCVAEGLLRTLE